MQEKHYCQAMHEPRMEVLSNKKHKKATMTKQTEGEDIT